MYYTDGNGRGQSAQVTATDATNFTISWTKISSSSGLTLKVLRVAEI